MGKDTTGYRGADWIKSALKVKEMSPLGEAVADLLGDMFFGIYHLDEKALRRVDWGNTHHIEFSLGWRSLATVDDNLLTVLVVLAHDRMLRVSIEASTHRYLRLLFHQRTVREGNLYERCPTLEDHVAQIRGHYGGGDEQGT